MRKVIKFDNQWKFFRGDLAPKKKLTAGAELKQEHMILAPHRQNMTIQNGGQ